MVGNSVLGGGHEDLDGREYQAKIGDVLVVAENQPHRRLPRLGLLMAPAIVADARKEGKMAERDRVPLFVAAAGLAVVAVGVFLPLWDSGSVVYAGIKGNSLLQSADGWVALIGLAWSALTIGRAFQGSAFGAGAPLLGGVIAVALAAYAATSDELMTLCPLDAAAITDVGCQRADAGLGVYAVGLGGALLLVSGVMLLSRRSASE